MDIHWSPEAVADFVGIVQFIRQDSAAAASRVARSIDEGIAQLKTFPNQGRPGRIAGTCELLFPPLPFVVVYRVKESFVEIVRILHGAQRWPQ
jgi:toxin ParE1/3/4